MTEEEKNKLYENAKNPYSDPKSIFECVQNNLKLKAIDIYKNKRLILLPAGRKVDVDAGDLLENVKKLLSDQRVKIIESLKRDKPILIVGQDRNLINLITSYIYLTHPLVEPSPEVEGFVDTFEIDKLRKGYVGRICFKEVICTGLSKELIEEILFKENKINHYLQGGGMLFIRGIDGKHKGIFKHISDKANKYYYGHGLGVLIVSTDTLSEDLKDQFESIYLDAEKQNNPQTIQDNVFRWAGGTWEITYDGKTIRQPEIKGLKYIHHLMLNENNEFYCLDLISVTNSIGSEENKQMLLQKGTQVENDELDERLKEGIPPKQLKKNLYMLNQKLESAESQEERENIQEKIDQIIERLENIQGEGSAEKARIAVYNAIDRALEKIKKEHPTLYEHLKSSLDTGVSFKYKPTTPICWALK